MIRYRDFLVFFAKTAIVTRHLSVACKHHQWGWGICFQDSEHTQLLAEASVTHFESPHTGEIHKQTEEEGEPGRPEGREGEKKREGDTKCCNVNTWETKTGKLL